MREKIRKLLLEAERLNRIHKERIEESRNKYEAAMKFEESNRFPVQVWVLGASSSWYLKGKYGLNMRKYFENPELQAFYQLKERIDAFREFDDDRLEICTRVGVPGGVVSHPSVIGCRIIFPEDDLPWIDMRHHPLDTPEKIDDFQVPEITKAGIMPQMIERYDKMNRLVGDLTDTYLMVGNGSPERPLQMAVYARGYRKLVKDMYTNPDLAHKLLRKMCDVGEAFHDFYRDLLGRDLSKYREVDLYDNFLYHFSPSLLRRFVLPYYREWAKRYGWENWTISSQCVLDPYIELMTEIPTKRITYLTSFSNLKLFKETFTSRKAWIKVAYEASLLQNQTPAQIEKESKRIIQTMTAGGGFIMGTACIGWNTSKENIHTFINTSKKYPL